MKTYIISDNHFFHKNIIQYANRPFRNIYEMNQTMIQRWNETVGDKDLVYHLGDFCLGKVKENIPEIIKKLNGYKVLILGNHDRLPKVVYLDFGFIGVHKELELLIDGKRIFLSHYPIETQRMCILGPFAASLHGHEHGYMGKRDRWIDCSVERQDYRPILLEEAIAKIKW
jgi:calcineurin-like phosphoesterase family protein